MGMQHKYLSRSALPILLLCVLLVCLSWLIDLAFHDDRNTVMMMKSGLYALVLSCIVSLMVRACRKAARVQRMLEEHLVCIYCAYILEPQDWPQQCPECGQQQTLDDVLAYWGPHAKRKRAKDQPEG